MKPSLQRLTRSQGFTLMEAVVYIALFAMVSGAITTFVRSTLSGFTSAEARSAVIKVGQDTSERLTHEVAVSRRIFDSGAASYLARLDLSSAPAVLNGSQLPTVEATGSLSVSSSSFVSAGVGNSILFAQNQGEVDLAGGTRTYRIDVYRFDYFYVTANPSQTLGGQSLLSLEEWRSITYASAPELLNITDPVASSQVINELRSAGIFYACDLSQNDPSSAFYALTPGTMAPQPLHEIPMGAVVGMLKVVTSVTGGSFRYGLCPNTSASFAPRDTVPLYSRAAGQFPAGFEVAVVGPPAARQVLARIVMAAQGSMATPLSHQQVAVTTINDNW